MNDWIKWGTGLLVMMGMLLTGFVQAEDRYAKQLEMRQEIGGLKLLHLEAELRDLKKQRFGLKSDKASRSLLKIERERLQEIEDAIEAIQKKIDVLQGGTVK